MRLVLESGAVGGSREEAATGGRYGPRVVVASASAHFLAIGVRDVRVRPGHPDHAGCGRHRGGPEDPVDVLHGPGDGAP
ncbi:hypothetical protein MOPEL_060_00010, partial [Mobilicoccus pelagius NBRC 104925]